MKITYTQQSIVIETTDALNDFEVIVALIENFEAARGDDLGRQGVSLAANDVDRVGGEQDA